VSDASQRKCVKCGATTGLELAYHATSTGICPFYFNHTAEEHLHYRCGRCGWDWIGPTFDSATGGDS